jgi:Amt family ammonium transporter
VGLLNGVIAGLAGITPASGYIDTPSSLVRSSFLMRKHTSLSLCLFVLSYSFFFTSPQILALVLGLSSYYSIKLLKHKLHIDDALDVSSVHGVTGMLGSLTIGIASQKSLNPNGPNTKNDG